MITADPVVTDVALHSLRTRYPRVVGRNARLGSHGDGGSSTVAVLTTADGRRGWGLYEGDPGATDLVVGRPLSELIDPATGILDPRLHWLDIALHDLLGVVTDQPVHALLGGRGDTTVDVYDGAIYFDDLDPEGDPGGLPTVLGNVTADAGLGHTAFKIKIGRGHRWMSPADGRARDVEVVRAIRAAHPDARLLVDANDGYDVPTMIDFVDATAEVGLYWIEEPFADDAENLAALRAHLDAVSPTTLIADGEAWPVVPELLPMAAAGSLDVLLMDVISYGFTAWRQVMDEVLGAGAVGSPHAWGRPLKTLYAAQLAAGLGGVEVVEGVPGTTDGVDTSAYLFVDGRLTVPDRPGFGLPVPTL